MCTEKMIVADAVGKELENLDRCIAVDLELGDTNDFECDINLNFWDKKKLNYGYMIYIPDTEYGGLIRTLPVRKNSGRLFFLHTAIPGPCFFTERGHIRPETGDCTAGAFSAPKRSLSALRILSPPRPHTANTSAYTGSTAAYTAISPFDKTGSSQV